MAAEDSFSDEGMAAYLETGNDYFYVVIQDATACCAQGLEFVWDDGSLLAGVSTGYLSSRRGW